MSYRKTFVRKSKLDFFDTPAICTELLMRQEKFYGNILEPACGRGAISKVLSKKYGVINVISSDIEKYGYGIQRDFFDISKANNIITNPPYNIAEKFLEHALDIYSKKVCFLLRLDFLHGQNRYELFSRYPISRVYVFSKRIEFRPEKKRDFGGGMTTAWFVWDKKYKGDTVLKFINCEVSK